MNKKYYVDITQEKLKNEKSKMIMINQIERFYNYEENYLNESNKYNTGDLVRLKKGTLLHGTYKNFEGLKEIVKNGLISSWFIDGRLSKYPSSVGVWNLKKDCLLKDYINFYSGGTILYAGVYENGNDTQMNKTDVIPYDKMNLILDEVMKVDCHMWTLEQTKEVRFMPSLVQNRVQVGIIFNGESKEIKNILLGDILSGNISDEDVREFVNPNYYENFIRERKNKNDFFTDRESAVLFGIPSNFIEGILVGRKYETDSTMLNKIKELVPNAYICNLDGIVIK
jgi:hypothetical protein